MSFRCFVSQGVLFFVACEVVRHGMGSKRTEQGPGAQSTTMLNHRECRKKERRNNNSLRRTRLTADCRAAALACVDKEELHLRA
jgi:hypothetical protein